MPARRRRRAPRRSCRSRARASASAGRSAARPAPAASWRAAAAPRSPCRADGRARETAPRPSAPHLLDHAEALAAAAVDGDAGGLVDADDRVVFVNDRELAPGRLRPLAAVGDPHRRNAHFVAEGQARVGAGAALVDAHLARADHAIEVGARHALQHLGEEVVEPLAVRCRIDADVLHERGRGGRGLARPGAAFAGAFAPYNALLHSLAKSLIFLSLASPSPVTRGRAERPDPVPANPVMQRRIAKAGSVPMRRRGSGMRRQSKQERIHDKVSQAADERETRLPCHRPASRAAALRPVTGSSPTSRFHTVSRAPTLAIAAVC